jgi:HPt (histidine-containing phosphotransfer) domain-containing protein
MLNTEQFTRNCGGDVTIASAFVTVFLDEYPLQLAAIERAQRESDAVTMQAMAHQLRGSLALLDARHASDTAEAVELVAANGRLEDASFPIKALRSELNELARELRELTFNTANHP